MLIGLVLALAGLVAGQELALAETQLRAHGGGFMVPLKQRQQEPSWRRHLLRSGYMPVQGSVREIG
eukprot:XP_001690255.1 predicted protein [Chlamydomonas reinhardtii]